MSVSSPRVSLGHVYSLMPSSRVSHSVRAHRHTHTHTHTHTPLGTATSTGGVELQLPVRVPGVMCNGEPQRYTTTHTHTHRSSLSLSHTYTTPLSLSQSSVPVRTHPHPLLLLHCLSPPQTLLQSRTFNGCMWYISRTHVAEILLLAEVYV